MKCLVFLTRRRNKKNMLFALFITVITGIMLLILIMQTGGGAGYRNAYVYQNGVLIDKIELAKSDGYELILESESGGINVIRVVNGRIGIASANCPDKTCVKTGFISDTYMPIICLPHKVEIRISGASGIDAVAN